MKQISTDQIGTVLQAVYQTNIPAQTFDALKKLFAELPDVPAPTPPVPEEKPKK